MTRSSLTFGPTGDIASLRCFSLRGEDALVGVSGRRIARVRDEEEGGEGGAAAADFIDVLIWAEAFRTLDSSDRSVLAEKASLSPFVGSS